METATRDNLNSPAAIAELQRSFVLRVYGWMTLGLAVTATASLYTIADPNLAPRAVSSSLLSWLLIVVELALVLVLSARIRTLGLGTARLAFLAYAALTGVSLTPFVFSYTTASIFLVFVITTGLFGAMCLYGHLTHRDLTAGGSYLFMSLVGLILISVVNVFLGSRLMDWLASLVGVVVFIGLTAFDAQAVKVLGASLDEKGELVQKAAIIGALQLYLDFINLFLRLLQLFGEQRDD